MILSAWPLCLSVLGFNFARLGLRSLGMTALGGR